MHKVCSTCVQLGGVFARTMPTLLDGTMDVDKIDEYIRPRDDPHQPWTALVCVENSHNNRGGKVLPLHYLAQVSLFIGKLFGNLEIVVDPNIAERFFINKYKQTSQ